MIVLVVTMAVLRLLDTSRTGRAWRAVREDPLAAASMTIPVNRVKLMAFAFGAAVAALAGTIFAAQQISVFPTDFDTPILILVYAGLILGGAGSIAGACTGALVVMVIYDGLLRSPTESGYLFYGLILLTLVARLRPWRRLALVLAATVALGYAVHAIAAAVSGSAVAGGPQLDRLDRRRTARLGGRPGQRHRGRELGIRAADRPAGRAGPGQRPVADDPVAADAVPGIIRLGDPAGRRACALPGILAHLFLNYMLDNKVAYANFYNFNGLPAAAELDRHRQAVSATRCRRTCPTPSCGRRTSTGLPGSWSWRRPATRCGTPSGRSSRRVR